MTDLMREVQYAFWKVHILRRAAEQPVYGQWIIKELRRHGYEISPGTLYPLLGRMVDEGWLRLVRGSGAQKGRRRDYVLTAKGQKALDSIRARFRELH